MTTATTRPPANRPDSLRSTGPRTAADQAARRPDAFPPGLVGPGDGGGSGRDEAVIARRAEAFGRELRAVGTLGLLLARRAAVLSVRMEHLATGELLAVAAAEERGRAEFDAERAAAIAERLAAARTPGGDPAGALGDLLGCPDGLAGLIEAWRDLGTRLRSSAPAEAAEVAGRWLGRGGSVDELIPRVEAEVGRLQSLAGSMTTQSQGIEQARREAGLIARFDPSPEATLARRYEAAAERGMYRAIRAIAEINRQGGQTDVAAPSPTTRLDHLGMAPLPRDLADRFSLSPAPELQPLASFRPPAVEPLASFRAGVAPGPRTVATTPNASPPLDPSPLDARARRPDLRKLDRKLAQARR